MARCVTDTAAILTSTERRPCVGMHVGMHVRRVRMESRLILRPLLFLLSLSPLLFLLLLLVLLRVPTVVPVAVGERGTVRAWDLFPIMGG
jgi:hypothetical protein